MIQTSHITQKLTFPGHQFILKRFNSNIEFRAKKFQSWLYYTSIQRGCQYNTVTEDMLPNSALPSSDLVQGAPSNQTSDRLTELAITYSRPSLQLYKYYIFIMIHAQSLILSSTKDVSWGSLSNHLHFSLLKSSITHFLKVLQHSNSNLFQFAISN